MAEMIYFRARGIITEALQLLSSERGHFSATGINFSRASNMSTKEKRKSGLYDFLCD